MRIQALALLINASGDTDIFAGTNAGGVFLTKNDGANWTQMINGLSDHDIQCLAVSPDGSGGFDIFAGTDNEWGF